MQTYLTPWASRNSFSFLDGTSTSFETFLYYAGKGAMTSAFSSGTEEGRGTVTGYVLDLVRDVIVLAYPFKLVGEALQ